MASEKGRGDGTVFLMAELGAGSFVRYSLPVTTQAATQDTLTEAIEQYSTALRSWWDAERELKSAQGCHDEAQEWMLEARRQARSLGMTQEQEREL
jgi:hypothetical protein